MPSTITTISDLRFPAQTKSDPDNYFVRDLTRDVGQIVVWIRFPRELLDLDPAEEREAKLGATPDFQCGLALYRKGDFKAAGAAFNRCLKVCADDHAATLYVERCTELAQDIPAGGWHGITVLDRKQ